MSDANLRYSVNRSLRWCDFGFPVNNRMYDFDKVREHMLSCGPIFHGLNVENIIIAMFRGVPIKQNL